MTKWIKCSDHDSPHGMEVLLYILKKEETEFDFIYKREFTIGNYDITEGKYLHQCPYFPDSYTEIHKDYKVIAWSLLPIITNWLLDIEKLYLLGE